MGSAVEPSDSIKDDAGKKYSMLTTDDANRLPSGDSGKRVGA
jgi:hypothetical protein